MSVVTVFLVDDHIVVREGLRAVLEREPDIRVVGEAGSAEDALAAIPAADPAVVVVDQRLPGMEGIELCAHIADLNLRTRVVVLSALLDGDIVAASLRAGAHAYVVKDVEAAELTRAIRACARGRTTVDPKAGSRFGRWADPARAHSLPLLSPRQSAVLRRLVEGASVRDIAAALGLSHETVKSYLRAVYGKLGVNSRAEAAAVAVRRGLV